MKNLLTKFWDNILFIETLFLLVFIPLYPKLPLIDVRNTWVYIRAEDFVVAIAIFSWIILLLKRKVSLKTPLTLPILVFWIVGAVATLHGVILIFPTLQNVFPNVAFLSLLRHIEYMSLFFVAYHGFKDIKKLPILLSVLVGVLIAVSLYGFGQKFIGLPAYLTMNEEFAKGIPIQLSALGRVPSTFAGHYDLAAYLVLIIPIIVSLAFGVKNYLVKFFLLFSSALGFVLLFMTVSRVSFLVLLISLFTVLFFQKKKLALLLIPLMGIVMFFAIQSQSTLLDRFKSTVSEVDVIVDAHTGEPLGHVKYVPKEYFRDKIVLQRKVSDIDELSAALNGLDQENYSSVSAVLPYKFVPDSVPLVTAVNINTGENLPQGTAYINLYLSPVLRRHTNFFYELPPDFKSVQANALMLRGDFIVKRASAYDLSFTTRFQGEWPNAIEAFKKNLLVGSGYGSVSLAVDNNYLRILGEVGLLGLLGLVGIFLILGVYIKSIYSDIDSKLVKSFIVGFGAGAIGLSLNAILIDVFEASKIAFLFWMLIGVIFAILGIYQKKEIDTLTEIKKAASGKFAVIIYLLVFTILLFIPTLNNYFVGDDFTWLRWIADCGNKCNPVESIVGFFTNSDGFFYRPGTKLYFLFMYKTFWLNQVIYHLASISLHFVVATLFYLLARKITKNNALSALGGFLFLVMSGSAEAVLWISSTGYLFNAALGLLAIFSYIHFRERGKIYYYLLSLVFIFLSLTFHEMGIVYPFLIILYELKDRVPHPRDLLKRKDLFFLFTPVIIYLLLRFYSNSHWFSGDYSYDLLKLPLNLVGNAFGYTMLTILGPLSLSLYEMLREVFRNNLSLIFILVALFLGLIYLGYKVLKLFTVDERKIIIFGVLFFLISLLPFLGLGNITSRYNYLASMGLILVFLVFIQKIYYYLRESGREIAFGITLLFVMLFSSFHIIQVQQSYFEWQEAGNKAKNFLISLEGSYANYWSSQDIEFHLIDIPTKVGNAWVFPVGVSDAIWFAFRNDKTRIFSYSDTKDAIDNARSHRPSSVMRFNSDGSIKEIYRSVILPAK